MTAFSALFGLGLIFLCAFTVQGIRFSVKAVKRGVTHKEIHSIRIQTTFLLFGGLFIGGFASAAHSSEIDLTIQNIIVLTPCIGIFPGVIALLWFFFSFKSPRIHLIGSHLDKKADN